MSLNGKTICTCLLVAVLLTVAGEARAQRTAEGSLAVGLAPMVSAYAVPSGGMDLYVGGYARSSFWKAGVRAVDWNHRIAADTGVEHDVLFDHIAWSAYGGWLYRLAGTYSRVFNIYLGGSLFIGLNQYEAFRVLPEELSTDMPQVEFAYGAVPELEMEVFMGRSAALVIGVQCPVTIGTSIKSDTWNLTGSVGVRINLHKL